MVDWPVRAGDEAHGPVFTRRGRTERNDRATNTAERFVLMTYSFTGEVRGPAAQTAKQFQVPSRVQSSSEQAPGSSARLQGLHTVLWALFLGPGVPPAACTMSQEESQWTQFPLTRTGSIRISEKMRITMLALLIFANMLAVREVSAHGRLIEPPSRASMWRYGFDTPHDYNDNECYCGGFTRQWQRNNGKCGICGDAWDSPVPRAHETGGKYGTGIIVRQYRTGSVIPVHVELTANHHGYFEFRTCAMTYRDKEVSQECLDKYLLRGENGTARFYPGPGNKVFKGFYKLPDGLTCKQCVFQWRYTAGNNWGDCGNGTSAVGCGPQEEFRGCADIAIGDDVKPLLPRPPEHPDKKPVPSEETPTESTWLPKSTPYWLFSVVIAGTCLLVVLAAMALLYSYYYHAGRAKKWLMARRIGTLGDIQPPVAPPRHKKYQMTKVSLQL